MFKWLKKLKIKLKSSCCFSVEIDNTDDKIDDITIDKENRTIIKNINYLSN